MSHNPSDPYRRDLRGNPVYKVEKSNSRTTILTPSGRRLGYMENGRTYDADGRLIGQYESEAIIVSHAGIRI